MSEFPTDTTTLEMLLTAVRPGEQAERSSLYDFLETFVVPEATAPWHPHDVIAALASELLRLRRIADQPAVAEENATSEPPAPG